MADDPEEMVRLWCHTPACGSSKLVRAGQTHECHGEPMLPEPRPLPHLTREQRAVLLGINKHHPFGRGYVPDGASQWRMINYLAKHGLVNYSSIGWTGGVFICTDFGRLAVGLPIDAREARAEMRRREQSDGR